MEWTRSTISATTDDLARGAARSGARSVATDAGPRQPARPDLGVRDLGVDRPGEPRRDHARRTGSTATPTCPIVFTDVDGRMRTLRAAGRQQRRRSTRAGCSSTRAASASRATATRGRAISSSTSTPGRRRWRRVAYDIDAVDARDARGRPARAARRAPAGTASERHGVIGGRRPLQGRKPGDRRVRVERPHAPYFRYTGPGQLTAKEAASAPTTGVGKTLASACGASCSAARSRARRSSASG